MALKGSPPTNQTKGSTIMSNNYAGFYKSYTESLAAFAKAARAETNSGYSDAMLSIERAYEDGFKDAMAHAFMLITGHEPDDERYETSCEDALCTGEDCNSNYCENIYDGCQHDQYSNSAKECDEHGWDELDCYNLTCDNCNAVITHAP